jgi:hypothetical protein
MDTEATVNMLLVPGKTGRLVESSHPGVTPLPVPMPFTFFSVVENALKHLIRKSFVTGMQEPKVN